MTQAINDNKKLTNEEIINHLKQLSSEEIMILYNEIITTFNLSDINISTQGASSAVAEEKEEQTEFSIILKSAGDSSKSKIGAIKVLRSITDLGLKEAKDAVDAAPYLIKEGISKEEANSIKEQFESVGASVEVK